MPVLALTRSDLKRLVTMSEAIDLMKVAFRELSAGRAISPLRTVIPASDGVSVMLVMPAYVSAASALGFKVVSIFPDNPARNLPTLNALVAVVDHETGVPKAILNGAYLTALRTGAVSGAATDLLARDDARHLVVFGAGKQAVTQAVAVAAVRPIERIHFVGRSQEGLERCRGDIEAEWPELADLVSFGTEASAIREADVVCLATTSSKPVFDHADVRPGTHINGVGSFKPEMQELPSATVAAATVVVDQSEAALEEAGDLIVPLREGVIERSHIAHELGQIVERNEPLRTSNDEITFFKSVGNAVQDMVVAQRAVERAEELGFGQRVSLD
jgi:ornithine cyclodeaminase